MRGFFCKPRKPFFLPINKKSFSPTLKGEIFYNDLNDEGFLLQTEKTFLPKPKEKDFSWYFWVEIINHKKHGVRAFLIFYGVS